MTQVLGIRDYRSRDAETCHDLRRAAFLGVFSSFLHKNAVQAGAESYSASEFGAQIGSMETLVAVINDELVGFCSIRLPSPSRAELLYLYISPGHKGKGIGSLLLRQAEQRVSRSYPELETIFLDTAVPEYNRAFWEHMGYQVSGKSYCEYPTGKIPALRLEKRLGRPGRKREIVPDRPLE